MDGRKARYLLNPDEEPVELSSKCVVDLSPGDTVSFQTPGGGGYENPFLRNPELVKHDVQRGYYTTQQVKENFGVVLNFKGEIDEKATQKLRNEQYL